MDFEFAPDMLMLRNMLRRFIQKDVRPLEMKYFTSGRLEPDERTHLRGAIEQMGLWGLTVPEQFGGGGLDLVTTCLLEIELGKSFIPLEIGEVPNLLYACSGDQIPSYLEPALAGERRAILAVREPSGTHPQSWSMRATPGANGSYVLNGQKLVVTQPHPEDFFVVIAKSPHDYTAFIVDSEDIYLSCTESRPNDCEYIVQFSEFQINNEFILGKPGNALKMIAPAAPTARVRAGARYVGIVERLLDMAVEHAKDWMVFGAPISVRPAVQRMLAETHAEVESARWLVYHAAWLIDLSRADQARCAAANVRLITGKLLQTAVDRVTIIFAGPGPSEAIEPYRLVYSTVPPEALNMAVEKAQAEITAVLFERHPNM